MHWKLIFLGTTILLMVLTPLGSSSLAIPANAFLSRSGRSWECERGFRREESTCIAVQVPPNAHLDYAGDNWKCNRGSHSHNSGCVAD